MARARNIKPAFFSNDLLAEIDPIGRLLFIGMWTIADYKGDIEWREKKIKAQVLPYDNCDVKNIAINLDKLGFIRFYSDNELTYINIVNFSKHQNPHKNEREKGSDIPAYTEIMRQAVDLKGLTINPDKSRLNQDEDGTTPADSLILIPDPCSLIPETLSPQSGKPDIDYNQSFEKVWKQYPSKQNKKKALAAFISYVKKKTLNVEDFAEYLLKDICKRCDSQQFGFDKLHFTTYVSGERWFDEITQNLSDADAKHEAWKRSIQETDYTDLLGEQ
jgi:hypothetical protein